MSAYGILLCGGSGTRMGVKGNKTLLPLGGVPACVHAARTFLSALDGLVAVVRREETETFAEVFRRYKIPCRITPGGDSRQASVRCGLSLLPEDAEYVLIHDGARPLVDEATVRRVLEGAMAHGAAAAAVPLSDTLKRADPDGLVRQTIPREHLYRMQTPQGFRLSLIRRAHEAATETLTDDAALVEAIGEPVYLVPGCADNIKLTTPEDVRMAERFFPPAFRVGSGYDAHRLVEGRKLILCGVEIPYEKGLLGHSDADVALHALTDALLGAAALGNIGGHFPDSDPIYKGISSLLLLEKAVDLLEEAGFRPINADVTIVAQAPKLAPYIEQMRENTAKALRLPVSQVSVKATTTEHMGYEGRGEGISANATALIGE